MSYSFWAVTVLIVLLATLGGVLFKIGTNELGSITFAKLVQIRVESSTVPYFLMVLGGVLLFFVGGYSLRDSNFVARYLFSPVIFAALIMLALSRFLVGIPLSVSGLGRLTALLTAMGVATTAVASVILFKEELSIRTIAGIIFAIVAVFLIGQEF